MKYESMSFHILLGRGYYQNNEDALRYVDVESLGEVILHPASGHAPGSPTKPAVRPE
jgi:hypothetical protein